MKSFINYIEEGSEKSKEHKWSDPHHSDEHDEVHTQHKALKDDPNTPDHVKHTLNHLRDKKNYHKAMKSGKTTHIHHKDADLHNMGNTEAADPNGMDKVDKEKRERVEGQYKNSHKKPIKKPIVLHDTHTGHKHFLAGNSRLTHGVQKEKSKVPVHTISYDSSKPPGK